jgi:hypothetical protein
MRRSGAEKILPEAFSARIEAVNALRAVRAQPDSAPRLHSAAGALRPIASQYGDAGSGATYSALADFTEIVGLLCEWRGAVWGAAQDAQRFLTAAQARAGAWMDEHGEDSALAGFKDVAVDVIALNSVAGVAAIAVKLGAIPLPLGIHTAPTSRTLRERMGLEEVEQQEREKPQALAVAFLKFTIDGRPLEEVHSVAPGENHDIDIEVRVSRWPKDATHLVVEPVTIEPPGTYQLPAFTIEAPTHEDGPFEFRQQGRFVLTVPQHFAARPFEFKYVARFSPSASEQPVEMVGQRVLTLEGIDRAQHKLTGYPAIDQRLLEVRNWMRILPQMVQHQQELENALTLAVALGKYCDNVVRDNLYPQIVSEREFQARLKSFLRMDPVIGPELEEHASAAGGFTDLSFRGIRIELKVEAIRRLSIGDCRAFTGQTASYAVGSGKHIGILCVLDCSPKDQPPFPMEGGIGMFTVHEDTGSPVHVMTFLLQGNLAKPSSLSG